MGLPHETNQETKTLTGFITIIKELGSTMTREKANTDITKMNLMSMIKQSLNVTCL